MYLLLNRSKSIPQNYGYFLKRKNDFFVNISHDPFSHNINGFFSLLKRLHSVNRQLVTFLLKFKTPHSFLKKLRKEQRERETFAICTR